MPKFRLRSFYSGGSRKRPLVEELKLSRHAPTLHISMTGETAPASLYLSERTSKAESQNKSRGDESSVLSSGAIRQHSLRWMRLAVQARAALQRGTVRIMELQATFHPVQPVFDVREFLRVQLVFGFRRKQCRDLFLGFQDPVWRLRMGAKGLGHGAFVALLHCSHFFEK